jgi:hypothetical protein
MASSETIDRISGFFGPCNFQPDAEGLSPGTQAEYQAAGAGSGIG